MIYIDSSAFIALINSDDPNNEIAIQTWKDLLEKKEKMMCNNYILIESIALIQRRHGLQSVTTLHNDIIPFIQIDWLDETLHNTIMQTVLSTNRRALSFVDQSSFNTMYRYKITTAFSFDDHFRKQGFDVIP